MSSENLARGISMSRNEDTVASAMSELTPGVFQKVSDFIQSIQPYEHILPTHLRQRMYDLKEDVDKNCASKEINPWTCEVQEFTMDDWKRGVRAPEKPVPVLQVYYQRLGREILSKPLPRDIHPASGNNALDMIGDQKNLQRILINSNILHAELEYIMSTRVLAPVVIRPPYKILLHYLPLIKKRLSKLVEKWTVEAAQHDSSRFTATPYLDARETIQLNDDLEPEGVEQKCDFEYAKDEVKNGIEAVPRDALSNDHHPDPPENFSQLKMQISHLQCLVEFIDHNLAGLIEMIDDIKSGRLEKIAFDDLWHLFKPGDLVFSGARNQKQLYRVHCVTGGRFIRPSQNFIATWAPVRVDAYMMAFDGQRVGPEGKSWQIHHYLGKRLITELPIYPVQLHPNSKDLLDKMEARGRKFMKSLGHKYYEGFAEQLSSNKLESDYMSSSSDDDDDYRHISPPKISQEYIVSEAFVDFEAYQADSSKYKPNLGKLHRSREPPEYDTQKLPRGLVITTEIPPETPDFNIDSNLADIYSFRKRTFLEPFDPTTKELDTEYLQLLPSEVPGYIFRYRMWYMLYVDMLQDIDPRRYSGFDDLVIPLRHRNLLVALVQNHTSGFQRRHERVKTNMGGVDSAQIDLVPGKGQGLIILLHGPPGSGKTSTAETIAAYTQRPLYAITCGDLGLEPQSVERQLSSHARRAEKWGCVLLLDEADVFLVSRTHRELKRNALVSVFLRHIEYYSGILFLTTNRPGTIDEAFKSRIHVSLPYAELDLESTRKMWNNLFDRLEEENKNAEIKVKFNRQKLLDFAEYHFKKRQKDGKTWNGRQVRNAFQTALALGHYGRWEDIKASGQTPEEVAKTGKKKWMTVTLTKRNFETVARTMHEFEDYIMTLRGKDSDIARESEVRDDNYDPNRNSQLPRKNYATTLPPRGFSFEVPGLYRPDQLYPDRTRRRQKTRHDRHSMDEDEHEEDDDDDDDDEDIDEDEDDEHRAVP